MHHERKCARSRSPPPAPLQPLKPLPTLKPRPGYPVQLGTAPPRSKYSAQAPPCPHSPRTSHSKPQTPPFRSGLPLVSPPSPHQPLARCRVWVGEAPEITCSGPCSREVFGAATPICAPGSVHLDRAVDLYDEPPGGEVADGARDEREEHRGDEHIGEVEHRAHDAHDLECAREVHEGVAEEEEARRARVQEGAPLPLVVLVAQLEVGEDDRHLRARDQQDE
mmetsp:Transcript_31076/g.53156  ORF Transcript_31076/g.53156 Transcript_31076/m.53156 type:complete len:222 (-) Transcript_31076:37-702(-)